GRGYVVVSGSAATATATHPSNISATSETRVASMPRAASSTRATEAPCQTVRRRGHADALCRFEPLMRTYAASGRTREGADATSFLAADQALAVHCGGRDRAGCDVRRDRRLERACDALTRRRARARRGGARHRRAPGGDAGRRPGDARLVRAPGRDA